MDSDTTIVARYIDQPVAESDFENEIWQECQPVTIEHYWSGEPAPAARHAEARICWSNEALHVRFVCAQQEPLVVRRIRKQIRKHLDSGIATFARSSSRPIRQILRDI